MVQLPVIFVVIVRRIEKAPGARLILERARYVGILAAAILLRPISTRITKTIPMRMPCGMALAGLFKDGGLQSGSDQHANTR